MKYDEFLKLVEERKVVKSEMDDIVKRKNDIILSRRTQYYDYLQIDCNKQFLTESVDTIINKYREKLRQIDDEIKQYTIILNE